MQVSCTLGRGTGRGRAARRQPGGTGEKAGAGPVPTPLLGSSALWPPGLAAAPRDAAPKGPARVSSTPGQARPE